jgi:hypothetical protein
MLIVAQLDKKFITLFELKVQYCVYKEPTTGDPILSQVNPVYTFVPYFFKVR